MDTLSTFYRMDLKYHLELQLLVFSPWCDLELSKIDFPCIPGQFRNEICLVLCLRRLQVVLINKELRLLFKLERLLVPRL